MKVFCRSADSRITTSVISIVVVVALCFSVGEGLQLTPFTISALIGAEAGDTRLTTKASNQISDHEHGPLDVPSQHQKRSKRHAAPLDFLLTAHSSAIPSTSRFSTTSEPSDIVSLLVVSRSASRAPPVVS